MRSLSALWWLLPALASLAGAFAAQSRAVFDPATVEHLVALSSPLFEAEPHVTADRLTRYPYLP